MADTIIRPGKASDYCSRWYRTRLAAAHGWSPPYVFDRWNGQLTPYEHDDWYTHETATLGLLPAVRGGAGWSSNLQRGRITVAAATDPGGTTAQTTAALDSAYTNNSAGDAVAGRYKLAGAWTVTSAYVYLTAKTGTVTSLNYELRNDNSSLPTGSVLSGGSGTINPDGLSLPSWASVSGLSVSLSADTNYWIVWGDADGSGSNFVTALRYTSLYAASSDYGNSDSLVTTGGFSSGNAYTARPSALVLGLSGGVAIGSPFVSTSTVANNTNRRGIYFSSGFTEQIKFFGLVGFAALTSSSGMEIYDSSATVPGTGALSIGSVNSMQQGASTIVGYYLSTPYTFAKATGYRAVFTFSSNSTSLQYLNIGTGADSVLASAMLGGGGWYFALANGTTDWSNDVTTGFPRGFPILEDQVEIAGGGGGLARIIGG